MSIPQHRLDLQMFVASFSEILSCQACRMLRDGRHVSPEGRANPVDFMHLFGIPADLLTLHVPGVLGLTGAR